MHPHACLSIVSPLSHSAFIRVLVISLSLPLPFAFLSSLYLSSSSSSLLYHSGLLCFHPLAMQRTTAECSLRSGRRLSCWTLAASSRSLVGAHDISKELDLRSIKLALNLGLVHAAFLKSLLKRLIPTIWLQIPRICSVSRQRDSHAWSDPACEAKQTRSALVIWEESSYALLIGASEERSCLEKEMASNESDGGTHCIEGKE